MIHRVQNAFRSVVLAPGINVTITDQAIPAAAAQTPVRTLGATLIDSVPLDDPVGQTANVLGFSVNGLLVTQETGNSPYYGQWGTVLAAIGTNFQVTQAGNLPFSQTVLPVPIDLSLSDDLWNPANNDMPPDISSSGPLSVRLDKELPFPLLFQAGMQLQIGLWMLPSLSISNANAPGATPTKYLVLLNANYTLIYDDNQPPSR